LPFTVARANLGKTLKIKLPIATISNERKFEVKGVFENSTRF